MSDELVSVLLEESSLKVLLATTTSVTRKVTAAHLAQGAAAEVLGLGLTGGLLIASLQKEDTRVNLQLSCDGALGGLFVDAGSDGTVRGYVKNPLAAMHGGEGAFKWRPLFGNAGYLSVLRDQGGGEFYRSSIELADFDLSRDLERYYTTSEQLPTQVVLETVPGADGALLGVTGGIFVQPLPDGDTAALAEVGARLKSGAFREALASGEDVTPTQLLSRLFGDRQDVDVLARYPLSFACNCSEERVRRVLQSMGKSELEDMLAKEGKAEVTCHFCAAQYVIGADALQEMLAAASN